MNERSRATMHFRHEHLELKRHLGHVAAMAGGLSTAIPSDQRAFMSKVVRFLEVQVAAHTTWEEKRLYPLIDELAGSSREPFTAALRHEHRVIRGWIEELADEATKPVPDVRFFARRTDNLVGLLEAHLAVEDEVLLSLVDRTMTAAQFRAVVGEHASLG